MMGQPDETWLDLEKLATRIYSELATDCVVTHNVLLPGSLSETQRQIDVLIENEELGTRVVVDCKDRGRRVDINAAAQFAGLVEDVQATRGVLICNKGFSKSTRTYAKKKGIALVRLHDVASRKWRLDVLLPVVWTRLRLKSLALSFRVRFNAGDPLDVDRLPRFVDRGKDVDIKEHFENAWNSGFLHQGRPASGVLSATLDLILPNGELRPNAEVSIRYETAGEAGLGYLPPKDARGIFDEETSSFTTVHFDVGRTLEQEPVGGWEPVFDPRDLAIRLTGTVITLDETEGVEVQFAGINSVVGVDSATKDFVWRRRES